MTSSRTPPRVILAAGSVLLAVALGGCSMLEALIPAKAERSVETQQIEQAGQQDVFDVNVGDCFDDIDLPSEELSDVPAVPCSEPHDNEIYFLFDLPGEEFPADIDEQADNGCWDQYAAFVDMEYEDSVELDFFAITPTAGSWMDDDREVICYVFDLNKQTTGTLAGAAR